MFYSNRNSQSVFPALVILTIGALSIWASRSLAADPTKTIAPTELDIKKIQSLLEGKCARVREHARDEFLLILNEYLSAECDKELGASSEKSSCTPRSVILRSTDQLEERYLRIKTILQTANSSKNRYRFVLIEADGNETPIEAAQIERSVESRLKKPCNETRLPVDPKGFYAMRSSVASLNDEINLSVFDEIDAANRAMKEGFSNSGEASARPKLAERGNKAIHHESQISDSSAPDHRRVPAATAR